MRQKLRRRLLLVLGAALILIAVLFYPSFLGCKITRDQLAVSTVSPFIVPVLEGYAVGFSFNVTNLSGCRLTPESIHVHVPQITYSDGTVAAVGWDEGGGLQATLEAGQSEKFSYTFNSYFAWKPVRLVMKVEMTFTDTGTFTLLDGTFDFLAET